MTRRGGGVGLSIVGLLTASLLTGCGAIRDNEQPLCGSHGPTILMAEAVPTAAMVPCLRTLPLGWRFGSFQARSGDALFTLDSDVAGKAALQAELSASCGVGEAKVAPSDEDGTTLYVASTGGDTAGAAGSNGVITVRWFYRFAGGCTRYTLSLPADRAPVLQGQIRSRASFVTRASLDQTMRSDTGRGLDISDDGP